MFTAVISFINDLRSVNRWWFCARVSSKQEQTERSIRVKRIMSVLCPIGILLLIAWTYYVFVGVLCIQKYLLSPTPQIPRAIAFLVIFHVILCLWLISYFRTMFTNPGKIPTEWAIPGSAGAPTEITLPPTIVSTEKKVKTLKGQQLNRVCKKCVPNRFKPDRCHHCATCDRCILKMDHHCPWVGGCVGYANYKFFLLVLFYTVVLCLFIVAGFLQEFVAALQSPLLRFNPLEVQIMIAFIASCVIVVAVVLFSLLHVEMLLHNQTTIERTEAKERFKYATSTDAPYDLRSKRENVEQVLGYNPLLWFIPYANTPGNGLSFPLGTKQLY